MKYDLFIGYPIPNATLICLLSLQIHLAEIDLIGFSYVLIKLFYESQFSHAQHLLTLTTPITHHTSSRTHRTSITALLHWSCIWMLSWLLTTPSNKQQHASEKKLVKLICVKYLCISVVPYLRMLYTYTRYTPSPSISRYLGYIPYVCVWYLECSRLFSFNFHFLYW